MKRIWPMVLALFLCFPANLFAQGLIPGLLDLSGIMSNMKFNYYAQAGYQWIGSNLNLPIQTERFAPPDLGLEIGDLDVSLKNGNFWCGMLGYSATFMEKFSYFSSMGGIIGRQFVTSGTVPVSIGPVGAPVNIEFTNSNVESWFYQSGIGLGPVLLGLYWDQFQFVLIDPRNAAGPLPNQTLKGDILTKTFAPFIGLSIPASGAVFTFTYSPLAYSNTNLSLTSSQNRLTDLRYSWNKPGDLINAMLQYNISLTPAVTFGLWANGSWMRMHQDADLEFVSSAPAISESKQVTATMTKYTAGGGISLGVNF